MKRQSIVWFFSMPISAADNDAESPGNHGVDVPSSAASSAKTAGFEVVGFVPKWRAVVDEDGHYCFAVAL